MIQLLLGSHDSLAPYLVEQKKIHSMQTHVLHADDFLHDSFESKVMFSKTLFGEREMYIIKNAATSLDLATILKSYSDTENIILFCEEKMVKKNKDIFVRENIEIIDFSGEKKKRDELYNIFSLADLLGRRDKKNLWLAYQEALDRVSPEEIHGVLFWQMKNLALAKWENGEGMKPFVLKKNMAYVQNFSGKEIKSIISDLVRIFHKRDSYSTLAIELEKIILSL